MFILESALVIIFTLHLYFVGSFVFCFSYSQVELKKHPPKNTTTNKKPEIEEEKGPCSLVLVKFLEDSSPVHVEVQTWFHRGRGLRQYGACP